MWIKQCHKPPMTGNGKHTNYQNGDDWGMGHGIVFLPTRVSNYSLSHSIPVTLHIT